MLPSMYAKLFSRIAQSSLMEEDIETRYCFMMLLAIADSGGDVIGTDVALARTVNLPLDTFKRCIVALMAPDPDSNSQVHEGRRIMPSESGRGYLLVNYATYRSIKTAEEKKAYMREYMQRRRKLLKDKDVTAVNVCKTALSDVTHAEGEGEADREEEEEAFQPEIPTTGQAPHDAQRKKTLRRENAKMLLDFLNETAGRSFRATDTNLDLIVSRLSEPDVTPEGCEAMIERQVALWKGTETEEYLQPSTLFGKQKFGGYYDKRELPVKLETKGNCL